MDPRSTFLMCSLVHKLCVNQIVYNCINYKCLRTQQKMILNDEILMYYDIITEVNTEIILVLSWHK